MTMRYWETAHTLAGQSPVGLDFDPAQVRLNLTLAQERTFGRGTVYLCYHPA